MSAAEEFVEAMQGVASSADRFNACAAYLTAVSVTSTCACGATITSGRVAYVAARRRAGGLSALGRKWRRALREHSRACPVSKAGRAYRERQVARRKRGRR